MEDILVKLAELLDMSIEGVINYYPVIRNQLIAYNILTSILTLLALLLLTSPILIVFGIMLLDMNGLIGSGNNLNWKHVRNIVLFLICLVVSFVLVNIGRNFLAADLMMIRQFL